MNLLVTGPPGSGKSTVLETTASRLRSRGFEVGGLKAPEMREAEGRVGFRLVDLRTGLDCVMAHVEREQGPRVGKYRVNVPGVEQVAHAALSTAREESDVVLIDEIAPMEVASEAFVREARACLEDALPVLGAVHGSSARGFIGEVKQREDVEVLRVTRNSREAIPSRLTSRVVDVLDELG